MSTTEAPDWLTVGAEVLGYRNAGYQTVERITKTTIILSDGSRWRTSDLMLPGTPPPNKRYGGDASWPRLMSRAAAEQQELRCLVGALDVAAGRCRYGMSDAGRQALRDAIVALAPHLGLTVTVAPAPIPTDAEEDPS